MHAFKPHVVYRCDGIKIVEMKYMHMIDASFQTLHPISDAVVIYCCVRDIYSALML